MQNVWDKASEDSNHRLRKNYDTSAPSMTINDTPILFTTTLKYLGVFFDRKMTFDEHIRIVIAKGT